MSTNYIPNQDLLEALLAGPYSHFKKYGTDDWRNPNEKNPGFSISSKGWSIDGDKGGKLYDLAVKHDLEIKNEYHQARIKDLPQSIWDKSEVPNHPDSRSFQLAKSYFTKHRNIPTENYSDLLINGLIRIYIYKDVLTLVYPSLTPETAALAIESKPYGVKRIQRIFLNPDGSKHPKGKRHLGSNEKDSAAFTISPLNNKDFSGHVVILEGLEDALSLRSEYPYSWFLVATDKAGLKHVQGFFKSGKIKECLIIADHDTDDNPEATGQVYAWQLGQKLEDMGIQVTVKMPPKPKEDANSALQSGQLRTWLKSLIDIPVEYHRTKEEFKTEEWPEPEEITAGLLPVVPLDDELIPEPFRAWIIDISNRMQCPVDYPSATVIVMCSILIGTRCSIRPKSKDSWQVVPNLWGGLVGNPSALKTPSIQEATKMLTKLENKAFEKFEDAQIQYQRDIRSWEMKKKIYEDDLKNAYKSKKTESVVVEEVESRLNEHEDNPPEEPNLKRYSTSDSTVPKLQELMSCNLQGLLILRDELHGFLMSLEQEGRESDRAFHLEAWSGQGCFTFDRIGRGTIRSELICESVFGSIQPARIIPNIRQTLSGSANDGLVQRFQVLVYPDVNTWSYVDKLPDKDAENRAYRLIQKLNDMDFVKDAGAILEDGNKIPYLRFSPDAQELFKDWISDLENRLRNSEETPAVQEHLGKYRSLMPSLALIFHLLDVADGKVFGNVTITSAQLAAAWCDYLESHARRIYHMAGNITQRAAGNLTMKIKQGKLDDGFTARDVQRKGWSILTEKEVVNFALIELAEAGWLKSKKQAPPQGGKTKDVFYINPMVKNISNT